LKKKLSRPVKELLQFPHIATMFPLHNTVSTYFQKPLTVHRTDKRLRRNDSVVS
jgi:hypothetical protein